MTSSAPSATFGASSHYASPESRALGSITMESYQKVYDDQGKFLSKMASDVSYLSATMRKVQRGVDTANENFIQQIQDLINNVIVIMGGGSFGDSGIDLGDLKYLLQMIGALFGFTSVGGIPVPLNIFDAAWHFFSTYIFPVDNFQDVINVIIDGVIAFMLDLLGEVPIVGQAAEQLAIIISDIRDLLTPVAAAVDAFLGAFGFDLSDPTAIADYFGPFKPIWEAIGTALDGITLPDFASVFHEIALWTLPFVDLIADVINAFAPILAETVTIAVGDVQPVVDWIATVIQELAPILGIITDVVNFIDPIISEIGDLVNDLQPVIDLILGLLSMFGFGTAPSGFNAATAAVNFFTTWLTGTLLPTFDASKIISGVLNQLRIPSLTTGWTGTIGANFLTGAINSAVTLIGNPLSSLFNSSGLISSFISGVLGTGLIPSLDASKITTGTFLQALIPGLTSGWGKTIDASLILGAVATATSVALSGITGLATGIATWLGSGGALPSATTAVASQIISGVFGTGLIPGLDASKIVSGQFAQTMVSGLVSQLTGATLKGSNQVISPDFEDSTILRTSIGGTLAYSTAQKHSGTQSLLCTQTGSDTGFYFLPISTTGGGNGSLIKTQPGQKFYVEVWVRGSAANNGAGFCNLNNATVDSTGVNTSQFGGIASITGATLKTAVWTKLSGYYTIPAGYDLWAPYIDLGGGSVAGDVVYVDDVTVREETAAQNIINQLFGGTAIGPALNTALTIVGNPLSSLFNSSGLVSSFISGVLGTGLIPGLDASKIISGTFANSFVPGVLPQTLWQASTVAAKNLVISPDFEDSTIFRETSAAAGSAFSYSTDVARSGTQSYKVITSNLTSGSNEAVILSPNTLGGGFSNVPASALKVQAGQWLYLEIYVRGKATNTTTAGLIYLAVKTRDSTGVNGTTFPTITAPSGGASSVNMSGLSSSAWTKLSGWVQVPTGYDLMWPQILLQSQNVANQTFYIDDARVAEETWAQSAIQQLFGGNSILSTILAAAVPGLDATKIITGLFGQARIPSLSSAGGYTGAIDGGVLSGAINLATTIGGTALSTLFSSGKFNPAQIASGAIASGVTLGAAALTGLATGIGTWLTSGGALPSATTAIASQIISGVFGTGLIPGLDASKIISGTFANSFVPGVLPIAKWSQQVFGGKNLVVSGDMEDNTVTRITGSYGTPANGVYGYSTAQAHGGTQSYSLQTGSGTGANQNDNVYFTGTPWDGVASIYDCMTTCQPGQWFYAECYVRAKSTNTASAGNGILALLYYNKATSSQTGANLQVTAVGSISNSGWTKFSGWAQIPAGYDRVLPYFGFQSVNVATQTYYIDDARCAEETWAQAAISQIFGSTSVGAALNTALTIVGNPLSSLFNGSGLVSSFISGVLGTGLIPGLDASKIISGTFANSFSPGLLPQTIFQSARTVAKNLIYNPDFEDSTAPLDGTFQATGSASYSTTFKHSGTQSLKFITGNGTAGGSSNAVGVGTNNAGTGAGSMWGGSHAASIKVTPGQWLYTEVYARAATTNTATAGGISISAFIDDSTGVNTAVLTNLTNALAPNAISNSGWTKLSGWYQIPAGYDYVRPFIWENNQNVINQTYYFDDVMIKEETEAQTTRDTLVNAWGSTGVVGHSLADLTSFAQTIPNTFVQGLLGQTQIGGTVSNFADNVVNAIQNNTSTNNSLGVLNSALSAMRSFLGYVTSGNPAASSVAGVGNTNNAFISTMPATKPTYANYDRTMDSTFELSNVSQATLGTIATNASTAAAQITGFINITHGGVKQSVAWIGYPQGGTLSGLGFYVSVYKFNPANNILTLVYNSADINGSVGTGTTPIWNYYNIPSGQYITCNQGDIYAVTITSFSQYNVLGYTTTAPQAPGTVNPPRIGAFYTPPLVTFDHVSTGAGHGSSGTTLNEPITIGANANFVCVGLVLSNYANASPPTTMACDIGGTNIPMIGNYTWLNTGTNSFQIRWFGLVFTPGLFGTSNTVHINVSGGTAILFEARALTYQWVGSAGIVGNASGNSATIASSVGVNGEAANVMCASVNGVAAMANTNGNTRNNLVGAGGVNYSAEWADVNGATSFTAGWSFGAGATTQWGISGLYLSPMYLASNTYTINTLASTSTPYMGLSGAAGATQYNPVLIPVYSSQSMANLATAYPWANWFDLVVCGGGAGGDHGGTFQGSYGGPCGTYNGVTLSKAQMGSAAHTWTIGAGGLGATSTSVGGGDAGNSSVAVTGWGTLTGNGGVGHQTTNGGAIATGTVNGSGGVTVPTYNFTNHYGGNDVFPGGAGGATPQAAGQQPGGGGAGGNANSYGSNINGGNGGAGIGYAFIYQ